MLSRDAKIAKGSTTAALDEPSHDNPERAVEILTEAQVRAREQEKAQLIGFALAGTGQDRGPRARRGRPDELRASEYAEPEPSIAVEQDVNEVELVAPIQGVESDDEGVAALQATIDSLETLRKNREADKIESKRAFEAAERDLLAKRDEAQRELERRRQLEAQRAVRGHVAAMKAQAAGEIPADPADRRNAYHRTFITQVTPLLNSVKETQSGLTAFAKSTLPFLRTVAAVTENDVPISWQKIHRDAMLGLPIAAAKLIEEHRAYIDQAARVIRAAEQVLSQETISDDVDTRTRNNGLLRDLGYASNSVIEHVSQRAASIASSFAEARKNGAEFARKDEPIVIVLPKPDKGRELIRRGEHHKYDTPTPQPGPLDSLGIDTSIPPVI